MDSNPLCSDSVVDQVDSKIIACNDISSNNSQLLQDSERALQQADSASEGAPQNTIVPIDHSTETNTAPEVPVVHKHSKTGQPRRNVGTYKQGPAKIRRLPIVGEEYDFSFSVISEWDQPVPITANRGNIQTKYHPQQHLQSLFLRNVTCSKTVGPAILLAFIRYIQTSSSTVGNLIIFISQILKIRDFSQCILLHQNITKTIHLGRLPRRVLFKQNSGKLCMWS